MFRLDEYDANVYGIYYINSTFVVLIKLKLNL